MTQWTKFKLLFWCLLVAVASPAIAQIHHETPSLPGHSSRMMKTAGFWISRHPSPDAVIMKPEAIDQFNASLLNKKLTKDIFTLIKDFGTESLPGDLQKDFSTFSTKSYYTSAGVRYDQGFMDKVKSNMNLGGVVVDVAPRYGLVVHFASQRFLPTNKGLYEKKGDYDFDQLQNSGLDVGTPVAVVHASSDGLWYYVMTDISDGWVEAKNVAIGDAAKVKEFAQASDFVVVIKPKADLFLNESMTNFDDYVRMGMRLPLVASDTGRVTVKVPTMGPAGTLIVSQAYMNPEDVNTGFLSFTARNIYKQALMMLNEPYGWGDMYGEQDCSRFMQMVFATMGIRLPRDSKDQAQASDNAAGINEESDDAAKIAAIAKAAAANTLLSMKGHIMLYLGTVKGRPYAIHDTTTNHYDRVIISDLSLGEGSEKGSLLRRLRKIVTIE